LLRGLERKHDGEEMEKGSIIIGRVPSLELTAERDAHWKVFEQNHHQYIRDIPNFLQECAGE
jgi:hypothetical protein